MKIAIICCIFVSVWAQDCKEIDRMCIASSQRVSEYHICQSYNFDNECWDWLQTNKDGKTVGEESLIDDTDTLGRDDEGMAVAVPAID